MSTIKVVLRQKQNKEKKFPIALRITKDRKASFIHLGVHISKSDWDSQNQRVKKSHPNSTRLNNFILKKLSEATDMSLELETQKPVVSSGTIKQRIKPKTTNAFMGQVDVYLSFLQMRGKYNQYMADKSRLNNFSKFLQDRDIAFSDITVSLLEKFKIFLKTNFTISERTIINHLVVIRSVFSQAIKNEVVDRKYYPFGGGKMKIKFPDSLKIGLTADEVKQLENTIFEPTSSECHAKNLWLFSFYLAGMRVSDVFRLRWSDIVDGRLFYAMGKNQKGGSLKLPQKGIDILDGYLHLKSSSDDYIFPELKKYYNSSDIFSLNKTIAFSTSRIDKILRNTVAPKANISKRLTMHIARHTFGNISGDRIQIQMLQKLYRHSSITTTIGYQANFIHKDADEALEAVIS